MEQGKVPNGPAQGKRRRGHRLHVTPHVVTIERTADEHQVNWAAYLLAKWAVKKYLSQSQSSSSQNEQQQNEEHGNG